MTACGSCRKRSRSEEDDCDDCLPISKRITRLNIRYEGHTGGEDCLEPLLANNNDVQGLNCCRDAWCDKHSVNREVPPGLGPVGTPQSLPPGQPGMSSNQLWQNGYANSGVPGSSHQMAQLNSDVVHGQEQVHHNIPHLSPTGHPVPDNLLHVPSNTSPAGQFNNSLEQYDPELSEVENPHYYQMNQVLYYAHMERLQRVSSQEPHDSIF